MAWKAAKFVRVVEPGEEHGVVGVQLKDTGEIFILETGDKIRIPSIGPTEMSIRIEEFSDIHPGDNHQYSVGTMKSCARLDKISWTIKDFIVVIDAGNYSPKNWGPELWVED